MYLHNLDIKWYAISNGWTCLGICMEKLCQWRDRSIGMLISSCALKSLNSIKKIQLRMMVAMFNGNPSTTIFCYSPTNVSDETDLIAFYNKLSSLVHSILKHNILIIGGDMNAHICKNVNNKFSLHNLSNRNREHLTDFTLENWLTCLHTKFQKRKRKLWIYIYANNAKAQIDFILINKKCNDSTLNYEAYSTFEGVSLNYWIVTAKICLSLHRNAAQTTKTIHYDWSLLNNRDIRDKNMLTLRNKVDTCLEISETPTLNEEYENLINAHLEVVAKCIPTKLRAKPRVPWET